MFNFPLDSKMNVSVHLFKSGPTRPPLAFCLWDGSLRSSHHSSWILTATDDCSQALLFLPQIVIFQEYNCLCIN